MEYEKCIKSVFYGGDDYMWGLVALQDKLLCLLLWSKVQYSKVSGLPLLPNLAFV